jgi:cell division protein YceG involved in septum cleavage
VPYLYFVAAPDGHHEFRSTFAEHTEARHEIRHATPAKHKPAQASPPPPPS